MQAGTLEKSVVPEATGIERFCMRAVVEALLKMGKGELTLVLPDGKKLVSQGDGAGEPARIEIGSYMFFRRCIEYGAIGFAESYMAGEWKSPDLTAVISWFLLNLENSTVLEGSSQRSPIFGLLNLINRIGHLLRPNNRVTGKKNISAHYDLSNELFALFLDPSMTYSSALFSGDNTDLERAQIEKYERICRSACLEPGQKILEIGCGWGGFASYAASRYGVRVLGLTISEQQYEWARASIERQNLGELIEIRLQDYRDVTGQFDRIVSIEMVEALGEAHVEEFFSQCSRLLSRDGLIALQMISSPDCRYELLRDGVDFIQKHIFPGSLLLSIERVVRASKATGDLHMLELFDFAESYARTLALWRENFVANIEKVRALGFDESFIRKWLYYFSYCEAAFAMRQISVVQITLTRPNNSYLREMRRLP